jgi:putative oxidoreductase
MSDFVSLISRLLMSSVFILYGYYKFADVNSILNNAGTKRFMEMVASGAAAPTWLGYLIAAIELVGGIAILVGIKTRWVAWAIFLYLIPVTYLGHPFWTTGNPGDKVNFYKNLAIMGAYLLLAIHGPGRYSVDGRPAPEA